MKSGRAGICLLLCLALAMALFACAYRGYEPEPVDNETEQHFTAPVRLTMEIEDLPMPVSQVEYTQWITAPPADQTAAQNAVQTAASNTQAGATQGGSQQAGNSQAGNAAQQNPPSSAMQSRYHTGISIVPPGIADVKAFLAAHPTQTGVGYTEDASLDAATRQSALNHVNSIRYVAGVPANVTWDDSKMFMAEATAMLMAVTGEVNHFPKQPSGITDDIFKIAAEGSKTSNLAYTVQSRDVVNQALRFFLGDSDADNLAMLGHRRWMLNPPLGKTAFGALGAYCAMTVRDKSNTQAGAAHSVVMFPGQVTPLSFFENSWAWSVSFTSDYNVNNTKVIMVRRGDGASWNFAKGSADGNFYINNEGYGMPRCVIFRPRGIAVQARDIFDVQLSGVKKNGADWLVQYTVQFI